MTPNPLREIEETLSSVNKSISSKTSNVGRSPQLTPTDLKNKDERVVVEFQLPRIRKEDISLVLQGNHLRITIDKEGENKQRSIGRKLDSRVVKIPDFDDINEEEVKATLESGTLTVILPKEQKNYEVPVNSTTEPMSKESIDNWYKNKIKEVLEDRKKREVYLTLRDLEHKTKNEWVSFDNIQSCFDRFKRLDTMKILRELQDAGLVIHTFNNLSREEGDGKSGKSYYRLKDLREEHREIVRETLNDNELR